MPLVQTRVADAVGIVTLDHASRHNAFSLGMERQPPAFRGE
jgi:enoyl-CoA hydratase/carnithine racemase